ncbi:NACHT, LRR and PYD domains-containing protein 1 homolog isoform X2 [Megalobrama amblycephala]|uniref:NACHT, LRR and PYD domains-containing protein 1 homolog isoform X2 n=1 Tax=Megalobrama amblycephala TaxID=75352 RepID=UPI002013FCC2|nr:NACHT, LRR and PYD domains-containing protein 1 homolog isoform X2 [Megalobrama amblycephala]
MSALVRGRTRTLSSLSICIKTSYEDPTLSSLTLTLPRSELIRIDWTNIQILRQRDLDALMHFFCSFSELQKLKMETSKEMTKKFSVWILQIIQKIPSVTELLVDAGFLLEEALKVFQRSYTRPDCTVEVHGYICNKQSQKCSKDRYQRCNERVTIHLNYQGFYMENERMPLFWD